MADANADADTEQHVTSTSSVVEVTFLDSERGQTPITLSPDLALQTDTWQAMYSTVQLDKS